MSKSPTTSSRKTIASGSPPSHSQNSPRRADSQRVESRRVESNGRERTVIEHGPHHGSASSTEVLLGACGLKKSYRKAKITIPVLNGVNFQVRQGEFASIVGQSGSGKTTLLHLLGTLDAPDEGEIQFNGRRIDNLQLKARDELRNQSFGMIFQFYHLLPELSTLENVLMPRMIAEGAIGYRMRRRKHVERAKELLELVGLTHRLSHRPRELSGGEMQRAAVARALVSDPQLLLADEPTGNLDRKNGQEVLEILRTLNQEQNLTIVMVTHDPVIAQQTDRIVRLVEGRVDAH